MIMKMLMAILFSLSFFIATSQSLEKVRKEFHKAVLDPVQSRAFYKYMQHLENSNTTIQAYSAVSEAMLAQVLWNPFSKLSRVIKYDNLMDKIIENDSENIEIRFLRLAIEYNLPAFLGMSDHIEEDIEIIKAKIKITQLNIDSYYKEYIFHFLRQSNLCSIEELAMLEDSFKSKLSD